MWQCWTIFCKDVKRLWPWAAVLTALFLVHGWIDLHIEHEFLRVLNTRGHGLEPLALFLVWWVLVAVLVQQERLPGNRQYWLTRPISRWSIVAAKAMFLLAFVCLPNLLVQAAVLAWTGFSPLQSAGALVWNQALIACGFASAAALAAVTRNLRQYAALSLALYGLAMFLETRIANTDGGQWMGVAWAQEAAVSVVGVAAGCAVLALQYRWRRTAIASAILGAGFVAELLLLNLPWWHTAFVITEATGHHDPADSQVRIAFAQPAVAMVRAQLAKPVRVALPVDIAGIPRARELASERASVELEAPGVRWTSGWLPDNEVAKRTEWRNEDEWLAEDGAYWLAFNLPDDVYTRVKGQTVRVKAGLALTLYSAPAVTKLPPRPRAYPVVEAGHGTLETINQMNMVHCMRPLTRPVALDFQIEPRDGRKPWETSSCCMISYSPIPADGLFSVWADIGSQPVAPDRPGLDDTYSVEVRRPLSFFGRQLTIETRMAEQ
jgi:hypothetical protein